MQRSCESQRSRRPLRNCPSSNTFNNLTCLTRTAKLCRTDAADSTTIHLDVAHPTAIDHVLSHEDVVRAFSTGQFNSAALRKRCVGLQRTDMEWLFQPNGACFAVPSKIKYGVAL